MIIDNFTLTNQKVPGRQATVTWIQKQDGEWNDSVTIVWFGDYRAFTSFLFILILVNG